MEELNFVHGSNSVASDQNLVNGLQVNHEPTNKLLLPANLDRPSDSGTSSEGDTVDSSDCNLPVLKYISDILLEEDLEGKPCMLEDILGLQAAEKSFYDALNQKDPPLPNQPSFSVHQSFENSDGGFQSSNGSIAAKTGSVWDFSETSHVQTSPVESLSDTTLVSDSFSDTQSLGNFRGVGEGNEIIDLEGYQCTPPGPNTLYRKLASVPENYGYNSTNGSKGKKNHQREEGHYTEEGRSNKQSAAFADDSDLQEMFDKGTRKLQHNKQSKGSKTKCSKKPNSNRQVVDLCKLLTECAQAVGSYDQQSASELLKQIRQHSSPYGYATQRLAHYFAEGLEARLAGARSLLYPPLLFMHASTTEILKAYQVYVSACPFKKMLHFFANRTIMKQTEKATRLHIIDFGISYGLQWPCLIQSLSEKTGGPPNLRITAIELPQPGFRPAERIEETGRRLAKYSERYGVPFEYNVIAKKWETIGLEELQIDRNEVIVVNCMHRLKQIPDETVMMNNPRDAVLNLIKRINPDLFMHGVVNGTYNAPAFVTRFKQLLFHFHALFDMYEATVPRDDEHRLLFERAIFGRDIKNVIACEGLERVERPETYKQWQARYVRAGFKQLPLDRELFKKVKTMSKMMGYHKDFGIEDDGEWMLQGWKGRIILALSALKPA
ncbi:unnamed protein product [Prunus armeniaca]|uniref:Uncharacterized protein n=1 Tax=Prunus armeniaca TaxID=36596 RepID=A0A6J5XGN0_PRUAR|nr:unnamed protein product [Prunus armeniaca]